MKKSDNDPGKKRKGWLFGLTGVLSAMTMFVAACGQSTGSHAAVDTSKVASDSEMAQVEEVVEDGMSAITADQLNDGTYEVTVDSSSSMFRVTACELTVADGQMTAVMTMGGTGYLYVYMGTGEEAAAAKAEDLIPFEENNNGEHTYTVPVEALDAGIACAAFSRNKEQWYDRTLVFRLDSLPQEALADGIVTSLEDLGLEDGSYQIEVSLEGGSGRAKIASPAALTVENGKAAATITWGSNNYDYMVVDGEKYLPVTTEEFSVFEIPVGGFDWKMPVAADTTAMSTPHEISYTLYFDSSTIEKAE